MSIWYPKGLLFSRRALHTFKHWSGVELTVVSDFLQSMDCSPPGFSVHGIFQTRIPEWVAISSSSGSSQTQDQTQVSWVSWTGMRILYCWATEEFPMKRIVVSKFENLGQAIDGSLGQRVGNLFSVIRCCCSVAKSCLLFATPWTAARQASLSFTISLSLLKLMSTESVMPSNHLILCHPLLLLPSIFPTIRVFFQWIGSLHQMVKVLELQHQSFQWIFRVDFPVVMYGCESWTIKKAEHWRIDAFELWCWRRLFKVPWTARRSNQSILKEMSWIFIGRTDAEAETPILWLPDAKNWLIWKDPDAGKDWRQEEKGTTEDEMVGWHHWLNGYEFE